MLIAESGATKTEWRLVNGPDDILAFRTSGFNPNVMSPDAIKRDLGEIVRKNLNGKQIDKLYFYGAGLGAASLRDRLAEMLKIYFPSSTIEVNHDLLAAARSTGFFEGIVCILGTGSNSCRYRHGEIIDRKGGHGFIFGDEGSGADLGKHLIKGLLENRFPASIKDFIESQEGEGIDEIKFAIYRSDKPNVRMARLSKYLDEILHYDEIRSMIYKRFLAFLDTSVLLYEGAELIPVNFVGSISYYFRDILRAACEERGITDVHIQHDPIDQLVAFHQNYALGKV
ncbi:MAG: hypothetical protein AAFY71_13095 [Bacteroidota bacterium]